MSSTSIVSSAAARSDCSRRAHSAAAATARARHAYFAQSTAKRRAQRHAVLGSAHADAAAFVLPRGSEACVSGAALLANAPPLLPLAVAHTERVADELAVHSYRVALHAPPALVPLSAQAAALAASESASAAFGAQPAPPLPTAGDVAALPRALLESAQDAARAAADAALSGNTRLRSTAAAQVPRHLPKQSSAAPVSGTAAPTAAATAAAATAAPLVLNLRPPSTAGVSDAMRAAKAAARAAKRAAAARAAESAPIDASSSSAAAAATADAPASDAEARGGEGDAQHVAHAGTVATQAMETNEGAKLAAPTAEAQASAVVVKRESIAEAPQSAVRSEVAKEERGEGGGSVAVAANAAEAVRSEQSERQSKPKVNKSALAAIAARALKKRQALKDALSAELDAKEGAASVPGQALTTATATTTTTATTSVAEPTAAEKAAAEQRRKAVLAREDLDEEAYLSGNSDDEKQLLLTFVSYRTKKKRVLLDVAAQERDGEARRARRRRVVRQLPQRHIAKFASIDVPSAEDLLEAQAAGTHTGRPVLLATTGSFAETYRSSSATRSQHSHAERIAAVRRICEHDASVADVARSLRVAPITVQAWHERYTTNGAFDAAKAAVSASKRRGRRPALSEHQRAACLALRAANPQYTAEDLAKAVGGVEVRYVESFLAKHAASAATGAAPHLASAQPSPQNSQNP